MEHIAKVIEVRQVSNAAIAILARCCGDPRTDSWHTAYDVENLTTHLVEHPKRVAMEHARIAPELAKAAAAGHTVTSNPVIEGPCHHCGRGILGTNTTSERT